MTTTNSDWKQVHQRIVSEDPYLQNPTSHPLRICCYGSSSELTPLDYLKEAYSLGYTLGKRGHTCVNGAGMAGCMAAMNDGASDADGNIVGVIHEMFVVDGSDWKEGSHGIFAAKSKASVQLLIAGGKDLQQRKKMLMENADAVVVCPGGPGTFDELWEMACSRNINLIDIPIVCINSKGFYDPFLQMLHRVYQDQLTKKQPHEIIHFVTNGLEAVQYIEEFYHTRRMGLHPEQPKLKLRHPQSLVERLGSAMSLSGFSSFMESSTTPGKSSKMVTSENMLHFVSGIAVGATLVATVMGQYHRQK